MRNLLKQFKKGSREVRLTVEEKSAMRQALVQFARENPIIHTSQAKNSRAVVSPYSFMRKARGFKILSATVIGGILIGGTVSFAAEGSLPGNVLYPVKTELNERVRSVVAVTPQAKADWDIKLVERRLSEVKEVGLLETVPLETKEVARANVKKYTERAQKRIVELDDNEDDEYALLAAENLARVLQEHESILLEDIHNKNYEIVEKQSSDEDDIEVKEIKTETKEPSRLKKEVKRIRAILPASTHVSNTPSTSILPIIVENTSISREDEKRQNENMEGARFKQNSIESLEKTVDDIREVREKLEKRNREKKAEYEQRKETRKEEEEKDKKDEELKTYISTPSSESER
jgi:hypothetical protein